MKIIFNTAMVLLMGGVAMVLQSVKANGDCYSQFDSAYKSAETEYQADLSRCANSKIPSLCSTEASLYYQKQLTDADNAFKTCIGDKS
jgi:hypothetical protein